MKRNIYRLISLLFFLQVTAIAQKTIVCPESDNSKKIECLGTLEAYDDIIVKSYNFIIYKETNLNTGSFTVRIVSDLVTGTSMTEDKAIKKAKTIKGKPYFTFGEPFKSTGGNDKRIIEYRFYCENGKPTSIEIYVVTRDSAYNPKEAKTLTVTWPG